MTILVGAVVTVLVQSSSVVSSALTPLAGVGLVSLERVYPMMLGANIGTTSTAILAAFAASGNRIEPSFQIAMCHLFFNLTGIIIWYPVPHMRKLPLKLAQFLGETTATYRWFAFVYLITMFFLLPVGIFVLSLPGWWLLALVGIPLIILAVTVAVINVIQTKRPQWLPGKLQSWEFLPLWLRSLEPMDTTMKKLIIKCNCCNCCDKILQVDKTEDQGASPDTTQRHTDKVTSSETSVSSDRLIEDRFTTGDESFMTENGRCLPQVNNESSGSVFSIRLSPADNLMPPFVFETCV